MQKFFNTQKNDFAAKVKTRQYIIPTTKDLPMRILAADTIRCICLNLSNVIQTPIKITHAIALSITQPHVYTNEYRQSKPQNKRAPQAFEPMVPMMAPDKPDTKPNASKLSYRDSCRLDGGIEC